MCSFFYSLGLTKDAPLLCTQATSVKASRSPLDRRCRYIRNTYPWRRSHQRRVACSCKERHQRCGSSAGRRSSSVPTCPGRRRTFGTLSERPALRVTPIRNSAQQRENGRCSKKIGGSPAGPRVQQTSEKASGRPSGRESTGAELKTCWNGGFTCKRDVVTA
ncbi:hypothetical protein T492DRAFT_1115276 [Pavlovales sp. CCMP2436]|nr:hypothetical protein T492DRAFT_1115276 [Pavlovales sp. CCMP2436]